MNFGSLARMKVEVEVYQSQISRIAIGDAAEVSAAAFSSVLHGVVTKIGLEVGRQQSIDLNPAANTDARVIKVTVLLDEGSSQMARGLTNLQVTAKINTEGRP